MDFVRRWLEKTGVGAGRFIRWLNITASKFYDWRFIRPRTPLSLEDARRLVAGYVEHYFTATSA